MMHRKKFLPWILISLLVADAFLAGRCVYVRVKNRIVRASASPEFRLMKAVLTKTPQALPSFDDVTRCHWFPEDFFDQPPMIEACEAIRNDDQMKLESLIAKGLDVNTEGRYGFTLLFWAFACDNLRLFNELLYHGADPDKQLNRCIDIGMDGYLCVNDSVLFSSTSRRKGDFLLAGLKYTQNPNQKDFSGETLLHRISRGFLTDSVLLKAVIDAGSDVNAKSQYGKTPMQDALTRIDYPAIVQLLDAGADPRRCDGGFAEFMRVLNLKKSQAKDRIRELNDRIRELELHGDQYPGNPQLEIKSCERSLEHLDAIKKLVAKFSESDSD